MARKGRAGLIIFIIILFLLIFGALVMVFNIGGARDFAYRLIGRDVNQESAANKTIEVELEREKDSLEAEKTKLSALRTDLENYKAQLDNREKELEEREVLLLDKEQEVDRLNEKLSGQYEDLRELIKIYEYMNGEEAADILSQMEDVDKVVLVIKNLKKETSAEILGLMDAEKAADILDRIY